MAEYYVYIMASHTKTLYVGITNNLLARVAEHKARTSDRSFTARYRIDRLAYFESSPEAQAAIEREKQIKSWRRAKKLALIEAVNPAWNDLSFGWYDAEQEPDGRAAIPRLRSE